MMRMKIKWRVTLWYAASMVLLSALVLAFVLAFSARFADTSAKDGLLSAVEESFLEMEYDDGELEIDKDLDFFSHGVYLSVYGREMALLFGRVPKELQTPPPFVSGKVQTVTAGGNGWHVYDSVREVGKYGQVWVRGIVSMSQAEAAMGTMLRLAAIALPFLVLLATAGGYFLTSRAFRPVARIAEAAGRIGEGRDLSRRIELGPGKDELHALAGAFNDMFGRLQDSFEREKQFTSDASHELRTPVSVIISQSEYALESADSLKEARGALHIILNQARKMAGLIAQLLTLARGDKGQEKLDLKHLDLSELAQMVAASQEELAQEKGISLQTDIAPGIMMAGDETMMMRLLINLVENAVTYGRPGGHILVSLSKADGEIKGSVEDDGIGISREDLPRIWERFFQADPSRSAARQGGMGLGLSMVKWIVESHGGHISADSTLGKGTSFTFTLPGEE